MLPPPPPPPPPPPQNSKRRVLVAAKLFALCALSLFLLTACGGGGGGGGGSSPPGTPNPPPPPTTQTCSDGTVIPIGDTCPPPPTEYARRKSGFESSDEYNVSYTSGTDFHLDRINAAAAYARGATGQGETIAIVDSGIRDTHRELSGSGKVTKVTQSGYNPDDDDKFHGTFVAALAVANRDGATDSTGLNMHGVAFDASVAFGEIRLGTSDGIYRPFRLENFSSLDDRSNAAFYGGIIEFARTAGASIINLSFGVNGAISEYDRRELRNRFGHTAATLAQASTADADKTILVWAAGNAAGHVLPDGSRPIFDSPEIGSGLGAYFPELQSHILAVVALDQDGSIASYSNRCGIAKDFCLAAPGSNIVSALSSGDNDYGAGFSGTSFAAPIVSGSLALLRQYFRGQLGNTELVTRLLATANRDGRYANSDTYGHGLVDLDTATAPVGRLMTGLPGDLDSHPFAGSGIALSGAAFGSSLQSALADVEVAAFDSLGAPFFQSAAAWVTQPAQERGGGFGSGTYREQRELSLAVAASPYQHNGATLSLGFNGDGAISDARFSFADGWWFSYGDHGGRALGLYNQSFDKPPKHHLNPAFQSLQSGPVESGAQRFSDSLAFAAPYLSLVRDGPGIGWSHSRAGGGRFGFALMHGAPQFNGQQNPGGKRGIGALLDLTINGRLSLQAGAVREADGFLGARPQGALGQAQGATAFVGLNGAWRLGGGWRMLASAYLGRTRTQVDGTGLLHDAGAILSSAFSIGAARASLWRRNDWFGLRLSQPLRVENGSLRLRLPTGRTTSREVVQADHQVNLAPTGRNLQLETTYHIPFAGGALKTSMGAEHHPQHDRASGIRPFMRLSFERRF